MDTSSSWRLVINPYSTVYDILTEPADAWRIVGLVLVGLLVGLVLAVSAFRSGSRGARILLLIWLILWLSMGIPMISRAVREGWRCRAWARSGQYGVVEGRVTKFRPMPYSGHAFESFEVNGVTFTYSDFDQSKCGFRNTASHGGPIREGLPVRIAYRDGRILKLEILRER